MAGEFPEVDVSFMGPCKEKSEMKKLLGNVHLVAFPSIWEENQPPVIREALLLGVPVICSSLGGAPEAIVDGVNGFIFDPYMEGDFAGKINRILEKPELLVKITEGARDTKIETMQGHIERIIKLYSESIRQVMDNH